MKILLPLQVYEAKKEEGRRGIGQKERWEEEEKRLESVLTVHLYDGIDDSDLLQFHFFLSLLLLTGREIHIERERNLKL